MRVPPLACFLLFEALAAAALPLVVRAVGQSL
jgi:hypothetical protein